MTPPLSNNEFFDLMCDLVEDRLSPEQLAELGDSLRADETTRQKYVDFMLIVGGLHRLRSEGCNAAGAIAELIPEAAATCQPGADSQTQAPSLPVIVPVPSSTSSPFVGSPLFACMVATVVLAVMLLGAWLYKISIPELPAVERSRSIATLDTPLPAIVGRVTGLHECRWGDADTETFLGAPVRIDSKYSLDAGLLGNHLQHRRTGYPRRPVRLCN